MTTSADHSQASEATAREIDVAVKDMIARAFDRAIATLGSRRTDLDQGVTLLLAKETITAGECPAIRSQSAAIGASADVAA
jgi:cell division protease FtsH